MTFPFFKILPLTLVALSACAPSSSSQSSRFDAGVMNFAAQPAVLDGQAKALTELSHRIVVQSTIKGAAMGAAVGCGLAVVSAGSASDCLTAAAVGGAGGAVLGNIAGKRDVARRIEKVSPSAVVRTLRKTNEQLALVRTSLPQRLAAQEQTLSRLEVQHATGAIDPETYRKARAEISAERQAIADALLQTQGHAKQATANLEAARNAGQAGLEWHISATSKLAADASSARSSISLL